MSLARFFRSLWLLRFSQPVADRLVYQLVKGRPIRSVVELGVGRGERTRRLLEVLSWTKSDSPLRYTGIDLFEARPAETPGLSLKQAFSVLKTPDVRLQLVPGDAAAALARTANMLSGTDLMIVAADQDPQTLTRAWRFVPRMLHDQSLVLLQDPATQLFRQVAPSEIQQWAAGPKGAHRKAA